MNTTRTSENVSATPACLGLGRIARLPLTPARGFWLALSLLAAALLAPSPAAAHSLGGDRHGHFNISLTPSTITEGQTTTVSYSYIWAKCDCPFRKPREQIRQRIHPTLEKCGIPDRRRGRQLQ